METHNVNFNGIPLRVEGVFIPGERGQMYYSDMSGLPDTPDNFEIEKVFVEDSAVDIVELFSVADLDYIAYEILENYETE